MMLAVCRQEIDGNEDNAGVTSAADQGDAASTNVDAEELLSAAAADLPQVEGQLARWQQFQGRSL